MSDLPSLKAGLWVKAHIRRCFVADMPAFVRHSGDPDHGSVLLKIDRREKGAEVLSPVANLDGTRTWLRLSGSAPISDKAAEDLIAKRLKFEPDLWVVEIEDPAGHHSLDEAIIDA